MLCGAVLAVLAGDWARFMGPSGRARRRVPINQSQMARQAGWRWLGGVYQEECWRWRTNEKEAELWEGGRRDVAG